LPVFIKKKAKHQAIGNYFIYIIVYLQYLFYICIMKSRKIYNRIALLRNEKSITRKELAEKIGVNFQTIGYLEREEYNPSLDLAFRISEIFGLPIHIIFSTEPLKPISELLNSKE